MGQTQMKTATLCAMLLAGAVEAQQRERVGDSFVSIAPGNEPVVAIITFENNYDSTQTQDTFLTFEGLQFGITAHLGVSASVPDTITVVVPEGYIAIPEELTIADMTSGEVFIYRMEYNGF